MRVLIVSQYFWPESFRITEVAKTLQSAGCDVNVLTGHPNYPDGMTFEGYYAWKATIEIVDGLRITRVPIIPRKQGTAISLTLNYLSFAFCASIFGPLMLRKHSFDCILVYGTSPIIQAIPAILLGKLKKTKVVLWVQDLWPESLDATGFISNPTILNLVERVVRYIYRNCDLLLAQSKAFIEPISRLSAGTPIIYYPQPGERIFSNKNHSQQKLTLSVGFNIVFAGNLGSVQALPTILEAASLLRHIHDIKFVLIGSGSRLEWVESEIKRLNLNNVSLPGRFSADAMPGILGQASALLISLIGNPIMGMTVPGKLQAYMAAEKPIIASMNGEGARIVLEAGAGFACPAEDAKALAAAIIKIYECSPSDLRKMGLSAGRYYKVNFEPNMLASKLIKILSQDAAGSK
jgi:glycosyltransferase involved in cell wall biosynthesis